MAENFEDLIREKEKEVQAIRQSFFPLIRDGVITGYNIYERPFALEGCPFFLNYLHAELGQDDRHLQELMAVLEREGIAGKVVNINHELVDKTEIRERNADYLTKPEWEDSPKMRYFTLDGTEIPPELAETLGIDLIGEVMQYDMVIRVNDEKDLRHIADQFKKHAAMHIIDGEGKKILDAHGKPIENKEAVYKAWDVPLLLCTPEDGKKPGCLTDFVDIRQFDVVQSLSNVPLVLSTLVRSKAGLLRDFLSERGFQFEEREKYVLRVFVDDYVDKE